MTSFCSKVEKWGAERWMHKEKTDFLPGPFSCDKPLTFFLSPLYFVTSFGLSNWQDTWLTVRCMSWLTESHPHWEVLSCRMSRLKTRHSLEVPLMSKSCAVMSHTEKYISSIKTSIVLLLNLYSLPGRSQNLLYVWSLPLILLWTCINKYFWD